MSFLKKYTNKIICGDCLKVLPRIPNSIIDLIIVDPPYNLRKGFKNDNLSVIAFLKFTKKWIDLLVPKLKETGSLYCFMGYDFYEETKNFFKEYLIFKREIIWHYRHGGDIRHIKNYLAEFDKIYYFVKSDQYIFNKLRNKPSKFTLERWDRFTDEQGFINWKDLTPSMKKSWKSKEKYEKKGKWSPYIGKPLGNVLYIPKCQPQSKEFNEHPTQKPEELIETFIRTSSNEGDLVLDPFLGSGTTVAIAKKLRCKFIGIEIERKYCDITLDRLKKVDVSKNILKV